MPLNLIQSATVMQHESPTEESVLSRCKETANEIPVESRKLNPVFPWRGRVVHIRAHRATRVKFDDSLNETTSIYDDYDDYWDLPHLDGRAAKRELRSILKHKGPRVPGPIGTDHLGGSTSRLPSPKIEEVAAVLSFLKTENRCPRIAISQKFRASGRGTKGIEKKLDIIIPFMLNEKYVKENIYEDLRMLEIHRCAKPQRIKLIPYKDEYELTRDNAPGIGVENNAEPTKGTLIKGRAQRVFSDGTVIMANESAPERIKCGQRYRAVIDEKLTLIECRKRLQGTCWQVLALDEDPRLHVLPEESIKRHNRLVTTQSLIFLGKKPFQDEVFVARVEAVKSGLCFVTLEEESYLSHLSIRTSRGSKTINAQVRALLHRGELLLAWTDLEQVFSGFGLSMTEIATSFPEVLLSLNGTQLFVLSTYKLHGFAESEYISTCDLACVLEKGEDPDGLLIRELLLI